MIEETQLPERFRNVIDDQIKVYRSGRSITRQNDIPDTTAVPLDNPKLWLRIPDVICVYVDMLGSTRLSAEKNDDATAGAYQLFTGTAVRLLSEFEAPYIDVRGDGAFALFNGNQPYRALAAVVSFKTFAREEFVPRVKEATGVEVGCHLGVDVKTVLVRKIGLRRAEGRTDRQNEVWAGKPVNMAAKLASLSGNEQLLVSDRFYERIKHDRARFSCGCGSSGKKELLWAPVDLSNHEQFDFGKAYLLKSQWCSKHGAEYCESILSLDR